MATHCSCGFAVVVVVLQLKPCNHVVATVEKSRESLPVFGAAQMHTPWPSVHACMQIIFMESL